MKLNRKKTFLYLSPSSRQQIASYLLIKCDESFSRWHWRQRETFPRIDFYQITFMKLKLYSWRFFDDRRRGDELLLCILLCCFFILRTYFSQIIRLPSIYLWMVEWYFLYLGHKYVYFSLFLSLSSPSSNAKWNNKQILIRPQLFYMTLYSINIVFPCLSDLHFFTRSIAC